MGRKSRQKWLNREQRSIDQEIRKLKNKKFFKIFFIFFIFLSIIGVSIWQLPNYYNKGEEKKIEDNEIAVIETNKGIIKLELYRSAAPKTVENFVNLANEGFYNGVKFHRIIEDFMIQTGDPLSKDDNPSDDGTGGPGYKFDDEINPWSLGLDEATIESLQSQGYKYNKELRSLPNVVGAVSMANSGPDTNGSQFFIITKSDQTHLDGKHTVFGNVLEGMDVVLDIAAVETDEMDRPIEDIVMESVYIDILDEGWDELEESEENNIEVTEVEVE